MRLQTYRFDDTSMQHAESAFTGSENTHQGTDPHNTL